MEHYFRLCHPLGHLPTCLWKMAQGFQKSDKVSLFDSQSDCDNHEGRDRIYLSLSGPYTQHAQLTFREHLTNKWNVQDASFPLLFLLLTVPLYAAICLLNFSKRWKIWPFVDLRFWENEQWTLRQNYNNHKNNNHFLGVDRVPGIRHSTSQMPPWQ